MRRPLAITRIVVLAIGVIQLLLGLALWSGKLDGLKPLHITIGSIFVIGLWVLAFLAARAGAKTVLVVLTVVWGLVVVGFGVSQEKILPDSGHWIIQVIHLILGIVALGLADRLPASTRTSTSELAESSPTTS
jgi:hypothetical protein